MAGYGFPHPSDEAPVQQQQQIDDMSERKAENSVFNRVFNPETQIHGNGGTTGDSYIYSQKDRTGLHGSGTDSGIEATFCAEKEKHFMKGTFGSAPYRGGSDEDTCNDPNVDGGGNDESSKVVNGSTSESFSRDVMASNGRGFHRDMYEDFKVNDGVSGEGSSIDESSFIPHDRETRDGSKQAESGSEKKRRSRWEPRDNESTETHEESSAQSGGKKRSRWAPQEPNPVIGQVQLPDFFKELTGGGELDPEVQAMNLRLLDINQRLQTGQVLEEREDGMRSPSPEPIYDNMGIRINTREYRARERLTRERQELICELIKKNPAFKAPADYRPPKLSKKLYIPMKEYPGYNFIGLIIGPRGNTQKRMQKETGAKIVIRGKGSIKEGRSQQKKDFGADCGENDDLHVYVEADNAASLEQAVSMVEKLLSPVDELQNEHKKAQLRELAALNGTMCENEICRLCGEPGHRHYMCPSKNSTFKSDVSCRICGDGGHPTIDCPVKNSTGASKMDDEYANFLAEVGGGQKAITTSSTNPQGVAQGLQSNPNGPAVGSSSAITPFRPGLGSVGQPHPSKEIDEANLYVGYLPPSVDDQGLINLFSPFGKIEDYKLIKDRVTGWSKGYGFVKFSDAAAAAQAVTHMNGYRLDGKVLAVRVAGRPPPPLPPQASPFQSNTNTMGYPSHGNQHPQPPMMPSTLMGSPPPWSIMPQAPPNPYGPPPANNYFANPPPPGAQQGVVYPYPSGLGHQHPPPGYMSGPMQGAPPNVIMNPNLPPAPGVMPSFTNGISPEIPQYSQGIPQYSQEVPQYAQEVPQYSQDYYGVPQPPPPASSSSSAPSGAMQQHQQQRQRGDVVETEYEKFMSEMRH